MYAFALFELLSTFDKTELVRLGKLVRSPFFTHRSEMERIIGHLVHCIYRKKPWPDKLTLFQKAFPGREYDDLLLRATLSDLRGLVEDFLIWQKVSSDKITSRLILAAALRERNLDKPFLQVTAKLETGLQERPEKNADHLRHVLDFQLEVAQFQTRTVRTGDLRLQPIADSIDTLYLAQKLRHACTQISHQAVFKADYDFGLLPDVLDRVESGGYLAEPSVALYYYCYRFLTEPQSLDFFRQFRSGLSENGHYFPFSELKNLYLLALNFCIRKLNERNEPFIREGWGLYREGLEKGFLLENGRLSGFTFNNIVAFGIKLQEFEAVEQFIQAYAERLEPGQQETYSHFNYARLEYTRRHFSSAIMHLQKADFKDLVNSLIAKTLLIKIYYETGEIDLLYSHLDSFRNFIRRSKVSDYHYRNFNNIISLTKKLISIRPGDTKAKLKLQAKILDTSVLSEREWLLEKCS